MQQDGMSSQFSVQHGESEALIRQGNTVQGKYVMPNVLADEGFNFPLAKVLRPDISKAMEMSVGVRNFSVGKTQMQILCLRISQGLLQSYIALRWLMDLLKQELIR